MNKQFLITDYLSKENINPQNNILETKKIRLEDFNQKSKIFEKKKQIKNKDFVFKNQFLNSDSLSSDSSERGKLNLKKTQSDFSVFESKIINFDLLPNDILLIIMNFLPLKDLILKFQCINKQIREICSDQKIWQYLSNKQNLTIATKYKKIQTICERRSKGKVYKAVSRLSNETVIIRKINVVDSNAGQDDGIPTSILREISYLSLLNNENISQIKEIEIKNNFVLLVYNFHSYNMKEYMRSLYQSPLLKYKSEQFEKEKSSNTLNLKTIKSLSFQILKGIAYLHNSGIIHRNLKSDNILITDRHQIKITDFSLSKLIQIPHSQYTPEDPKERERSGREARRLWYKAPELLLRKDLYSFEIDIWSFGCILAELSINEPLFNGETEIEQLFRIFRLIGSPLKKSDWDSINSNGEEFRFMFPKWESIQFPHIILDKNSKEYKNIEKIMMPNRELPFNKLKKIGNIIGFDGLDLLQKCLDLHPDKRISAKLALNHSFFDEIRNNFGIEEEYKEKINFNLQNLENTSLIGIFKMMKKNELKINSKQNKINFISEQSRNILVDWIIDVNTGFNILDETLHFAVSYVDRYLSKNKIDKTKMQLIGVSCMNVFNERSKEYYKQEKSKEYAYITADEFESQEVIEMEKIILKEMNYNLASFSIVHFLKLYYFYFTITSPSILLCSFLSDLMLLNPSILKYKPSLIAFSILLIGLKNSDINKLNQILQIDKNDDIKIHFKATKLYKCCNEIVSWLINFKSDPNYMIFDSVFSKYENSFEIDPRDYNIINLIENDFLI